MRFSVLGLLMLLLLGLDSDPVSAAQKFSVTVDPQTFGVNDSAELTVTVTGDEDAIPVIPQVPGLIINPEGQSVAFQQVNGASTTIFARTYRVTANREGTFTIPPIHIGGTTTAPLVIHVGATGSGGGAGASGEESGADRHSAIDVAAIVRAAMPIMKLTLPKSRLYVGELVPIQIKAYFRHDVNPRIEGPLALVGDAFTLSGLDKQATQTEELVGGASYAVLTWNAVLGALKSGDYPISLELPVSLHVQLPGTDSDIASRLRALFGANYPGALMDESDFGDLFGKVVEKDVTVKPDATSVTVLPLPVEGRPADFTGAVGQFKIASELTPTTGAVGDPLTFKLTVTGKGNLSRVNADVLHDSPQWRVYRADSKVTADDDSGMQGFKTMSQPVVPLQAGQLTVPALSFSYFDPEAARYVTRQTQPISVTVTPGVAPSQAVSPLQAGAPPAGVQGDALAPDMTLSGGHTSTLEPLVWRPWWIGAALAPIALMLAALILIRRHQLRSGDPVLMLHAARLAAVKINLEAMSAALSRADSVALFTAARHALQERLADLWQVPAESVDEQLVAARLSQEGAELQAIFAMAEKATYGGVSLSPQALQEWQRRVLEQMDRLDDVT